MKDKGIEKELHESTVQSSLQMTIRHAVLTLPDEEVFEWTDRARVRLGVIRRWSLAEVAYWTPAHREAIVRHLRDWFIKKSSIQSVVNSILFDLFCRGEEAFMMALMIKSARSFASSSKTNFVGITDEKLLDQVAKVLEDSEDDLFGDNKDAEDGVARIQWRGNHMMAWMGRLQQSLSSWNALLRYQIRSMERKELMLTSMEALLEISHGMACWEALGESPVRSRVYTQEQAIWLHDRTRDMAVALDASLLPAKMIERAKRGSSTKTILSRYARSIVIEKMAYYVDEAMDCVARMERVQ